MRIAWAILVLVMFVSYTRGWSLDSIVCVITRNNTRLSRELAFSLPLRVILFIEFTFKIATFHFCFTL